MRFMLWIKWLPIIRRYTPKRLIISKHRTIFYSAYKTTGILCFTNNTKCMAILNCSISAIDYICKSWSVFLRIDYYICIVISDFLFVSYLLYKSRNIIGSIDTTYHRTIFYLRSGSWWWFSKSSNWILTLQAIFLHSNSDVIICSTISGIWFIIMYLIFFIKSRICINCTSRNCAIVLINKTVLSYYSIHNSTINNIVFISF